MRLLLTRDHRQHIVKQHKRDDPSAFVCDRCNRDFHTRKELRDHQRLPKEEMCDILDHDPESGVDGTTSIKLLSRKRASGASPEAQWKEIWNILFPDDEDHQVHPYRMHSIYAVNRERRLEHSLMSVEQILPPSLNISSFPIITCHLSKSCTLLFATRSQTPRRLRL